MGYYLRKAVNIGPIRLNLSGSGVGVSVGFTGLRLGVRPTGKAYIHAGRGGVYYRSELGEIFDAPGSRQIAFGGTVHFETVSAEELARTSNSQVVRMMNEVISLRRRDYDVYAMTLCAGSLLCIFSMAVLCLFPLAGIALFFGSLAASTVGLFFAEATRRWEQRKRTLYLNYCLEGRFCEAFELLVSAVNRLASCERVWCITDSRLLPSRHEAKRHAGASSLASRTNVRVGSGAPAWIVPNIPIPTIETRGQAYHFLPDGVLVDDGRHIGFVTYAELAFSTDWQSWIESEVVPSDGEIVGWTWKHPNKDGGPDRRFASNYQIPKCRYGVLGVTSASGVSLLLQTSLANAPAQFVADYQRFLEKLLPASREFGTPDSPDAFRSWLQVNPEHNQSFADFSRAWLKSSPQIPLAPIVAVDRVLKGMVDTDRPILLWTLRIQVVIVLALIMVLVTNLLRAPSARNEHPPGSSQKTGLGTSDREPSMAGVDQFQSMSEDFVFRFPMYLVADMSEDTFEPILFSGETWKAIPFFTERMRAEQYRDLHFQGAGIERIETIDELRAYAEACRQGYNAEYVAIDPLPEGGKASCIRIDDIPQD